MIHIARVSLFAASVFATCALSAQTPDDPLKLTSHHATASVGDLNRAIKWYQDKLGFKMAQRRALDPNTEIAIMTVPGYRVDLLQRKGSSRASAPKDHLFAQGWAHIVFSVADADKAYATLKARGVDLPEPLTNDTVFHAKYTHFPDSEGNWMAIYQEVVTPKTK